MSTTIETVAAQRGDMHPINAEHDFAATGTTDAVQFSKGDITVQVTGAATAITAQVERSTRDPAAGSPNWAPAGPAITGNPSTGVQGVAYSETAGGWWRVRVTTLTGGNALVVMSGVGG